MKLSLRLPSKHSQFIQILMGVVFFMSTACTPQFVIPSAAITPPSTKVSPTGYPTLPATNAEYINIFPQAVQFSDNVGDLDGSGEVRLIVITSDDQGHSDGLVCPGNHPLQVAPGQRIAPCSGGLVYPKENLGDYIYILVLVLDEDKINVATDFGLDIVTSLLANALTELIAASFVPNPGTAVGISLFALDVLVGFGSEALQEWYEQQDVLGSQSFVLYRDSGWGAEHKIVEASDNHQVTFEIDIRESASVYGKLVDVSGNGTTSPASTESLPVPTPQPIITESPPGSISQSTDSIAEPTEQPTGNLIAFVSTQFGSMDIFIMNRKGKQIKQITNWPGDERTPAWSPDGKKISFYSPKDGDEEIYIIDLETRKIVQVTNNNCNDYAAAWSPDGKKLAYYSDCDGNREIYTINIDGSGRKQLTHTSKVYNWFPNWSPSGDQITYSTNESGVYFVNVMDTDGSNQTPLARGCISSFSPNGKRIVYASYCTDYGNIFIMKANGMNARAITSDNHHRNPTWSSDGTLIVYQSEIGGDAEIWIMDTNGENRVQLTNNNHKDAEPVWQPQK